MIIGLKNNAANLNGDFAAMLTKIFDPAEADQAKVKEDFVGFKSRLLDTQYDGKDIFVDQVVKNSLRKKAQLPPILEAVLARPLTPEERANGVSDAELLG